VDVPGRAAVIWSPGRRGKRNACAGAPLTTTSRDLEDPALGGRAGTRGAGWTSLGLILLALAGLLASLAADWPGHFSVDSVSQMAQGREGLYDDWHPPIMAWLLGLADRMGTHGGAFIAMDSALFFGGLLVFALAGSRPRPIALAAMALAIASPQALVFQGVVWKDILFADTTIGGFAALALAGRWWRAPMIRAGCLALAFALFLVALLARQTGFVAGLAGAATYAAIAAAAEAGRPRTLARSLLTAGAALAALVALAAAIDFAFSLRSDGEPGGAAQLAMLQAYDLAGAAHIDPTVAMPALRARAPAFEWFERAQAGPRFRPGTIDYLDGLPGADILLPPDGPVVAADWRRLILRRPWLYARVRAAVFWSTLATPANQNCPLVSVGVETDDLEALARAGLSSRRNAKDDWDDDYVEAFDGTPVLSHLAWGALAGGLLVMSLWDIVRRGDRRPASLAIVGLLAAAFAFVAGFFVVSLACDYRYLYLLDTAALVAAVHRASAGPYAARPSTAVARRSSLPQPTR